MGEGTRGESDIISELRLGKGGGGGRTSVGLCGSDGSHHKSAYYDGADSL